jgi:DNA-binding HxlR family transcriptional regulator
METIENRPGCVKNTLTIMGDKWTGIILQKMIEGVCRFGTLQDSVAGISPRTLSQRLDYLEEQAIITKQVFAEMPPRVDYKLTPKGVDLVPILKQMATWGEKYPSL